MFISIEPSLSLDAISAKLIAGLPQELRYPGSSKTLWTEAIMRGLRSIGEAHGFKVYCRGHERNEYPEWLLDNIWLNHADGRTVLAVESEWGTPGQVEDDFLKLLSIKARCKLILFFTDKNHRRAAEYLAKLESSLQVYPYHLSGEQYLALERNAEGAFRYFLEIPSDGQLAGSAKFTDFGEPLPWPWATRLCNEDSSRR
jgi:hypothetical protein